MDDKLKDIFANINEWLKFAEAKNGALLGINAAVLTTLLSNLDKVHTNLIIETVLLNLYLPLALVSTFIGLFSFLPASKKDIDTSKLGAVKSTDNLLYFAEIQKYTPDYYLTELAPSLPSPPATAFTRLQMDYAYQIIVNAKITAKKYRYFKWAIWADMAGIFLSFLLAVVLILVKMSFCF